MSTVFQLFATTAAQAPANDFLFVDAVTARANGIPAQPVNWQAALDEVEQLRVAYAVAGYGPGHRVGLLLENRPAAGARRRAVRGLAVSDQPGPAAAHRRAADLPPLKIEKGSGSPLRVLALVEDKA
jgi:hypothetical protein